PTPALNRNTLEPHGVLEVRCPRLRRASPDLDRRFDPGRVLDRPCLQEDQTRHRLNRAEYRRPASGAEVPLGGALVALADGLDRGARVTLDRQCIARYAHDHRERSRGLALTVRAVARALPHRLGIDAVGHAAAEASTSDRSGCVGHEPTLYQRDHAPASGA